MRRKIDNQTLDAIGRTLIKADAARGPQIDAVINDPYVFTRIRSRIREENLAGQPAARAVIFLRPRYFVLAGVAVALGASIFALSIFNSGRGTVAVNRDKVLPQREDTARPEIPPQKKGIMSEVPEEGRADQTGFRPERAVLRDTKPKRSTPRAAASEPERDEFYPVAYTGDPAEIDSGGRIIRVDVKRASLFALGIPVPLENGSDTVKAELLIGNDGVTRGIRIVDQ